MTTTTAFSTTYQLRGWDLSELLPAATEPVVARRFAELETAVTEFEALRERLGADMERRELLAVLRRHEAI